VADRDRRGTEFGGKPGMVQPPPHPLTASEAAMLERMADPMDPGANAETVLAEKRERREYEADSL
jgi:hypothetical protein